MAFDGDGEELKESEMTKVTAIRIWSCSWLVIAVLSSAAFTHGDNFLGVLLAIWAGASLSAWINGVVEGK